MTKIIKAFILIETTRSKNKEVTNAIRQLQGVKSVDSVTGPYDVIALIETESMNEIGDFLTRELRGITGIDRTLTCICI